MSTRREFLCGAAAGIVAASQTVGAGRVAAAPRPRNVVFILTDDQRFDGVSILGHPYVETPHLDGIARNGIIFDRAFVTTALCSPSRASVLTGTYAHVHGVLDNNTPLPAELPVFPQGLRGAGYRTGFVGKWHMGGASDAPHPAFDHWVSFPGQGRYMNQTLNINGQRTETSGYITDVLTEHAVEFMRASREQPFFLYLSHKAVHAEFLPAPRHQGCYADKTYPHPASMADTEENYRGKPAWVRAQRKSWHGVDGMYNHTVDFDQFTRAYSETLRAIDDSVGRVVETLRELGMLESTLLLFTSDNGFQFGEHGLIDKRTFYEASIRVPLIVHCPELAGPGQRRSEMITNVDYAPTFLDLAGVAAPESMQGRSFLPLLRGETVPWRQAFLYEYFWERNFPQTPTVLGLRTDRHKLSYYQGVWDKYEIYDLEQDPDEMHNLLGDFLQNGEGGTLDELIARKAPPEIATLFKELRGRLFAELDAVGCSRDPSW